MGVAPPRLNPRVTMNGNYSECAYNVEETIADSSFVIITFAITTVGEMKLVLVNAITKIKIARHSQYILE